MTVSSICELSLIEFIWKKLDTGGFLHCEKEKKNTWMSEILTMKSILVRNITSSFLAVRAYVCIYVYGIIYALCYDTLYAYITHTYTHSMSFYII